MKSIVIVMISAAALNAASCLQSAQYEAPMNCFRSEAAGKPTLVRGLCNKMRHPRTSQIIEENFFECTCALTTHTFWYKRLASEPVRMLAALIDHTFESLFKPDIRNKQLMDELLYGLYDKVEWLRTGSSPSKRQNFLENLYAKLPRKSENPSAQIANGKAEVKKICRHLMGDSDLKNFIIPTLEVIRNDTRYGEPSYRGLIVSVPELSRIMSVVNLCQNLAGEGV